MLDLYAPTKRVLRQARRVLRDHEPDPAGGCPECGTTGHCVWRAVALGQLRIAEALTDS